MVYTRENQGSISCLKKMLGKGKILARVRRVYEVAAAHVDLEFIWKPKDSESAEIQHADTLSSLEDMWIHQILR